MTAQTPAIQDDFNSGQLIRLQNACESLGIGDVLSLLIRSLPATEAAATVTSNAKTLSNPASRLLDIVVTAGTVTGAITTIFRVAGAAFSTYPLASHQAVWDGTSAVRFAAADGVTAADFRYTLANSPLTVGWMARQIGERD
jgi:hypothetical protein